MSSETIKESDIKIETDKKPKDSKSKDKKPKDEKLLIFANPEKKQLTRIGPGEFMPFSCSRILLSGPPGSGKRNIILNIIHRMDPKPKAIHIVHCDSDTTEYNCLAEKHDKIYLYEPTDFPTIDNIMNPGESDSEDDIEESESEEDTRPNLVIVDEITSGNLDKKGAHRFERLVNHIATHKNTIVMCSIQSLLNLPAKVRRAFNFMILWKQPDEGLNVMISKRSGIKREFLDVLFGLCKDKHDSITIDLDADPTSQWRYRLNLLYPINCMDV